MNSPCDTCDNMGARCPRDAQCCEFADYLDDINLVKVSEHTCANCEYGDYNKQSKQEECNFIIDGDALRLSGGMRWFVRVMGCGRWVKISEGNPRAYKPK